MNQTMPKLSPELQQLAADIIQQTDEAAIPGPVLSAFLPEGLKVGPFLLPPVTFAHMMLLHAADSPFATGREVTTQSLTMDVAAAVHILTRPWKETRQAVEQGTIGEAIWETAANLPAFSPEEFQQVVENLAKHVNKGFDTALAMQQQEGGIDEGQKKTGASVGGSSL